MKNDQSKKRKINFKLIIAVIAIIVVGIIAANNVAKKNVEYEVYEVSQYKYFILIEEGKYGVIDKMGEVLVSAKYEEIIIPNPEENLFIATLDGSCTVINDNEEELLTKYETVEAIKLKNITTDLMYEKTVLKYKEDDKWGLIDYEGKKILPAELDEISTLEYKEGEMLVNKEGKVGIINLNGYYIIEPKYDQIQTDKYYQTTNGQKEAGYIVTEITDDGYRYGYINNKGETYLEASYTQITRILNVGNVDEAYLLVAQNGQYGVYKNQNKIVDHLYKTIRYDTANEILVVERAKKIGILSLDGNEIIEPKYEQIDVNGIYMYATDSNSEITVYDLNGQQKDVQSDVYILNTGEKYKIQISSRAGLEYNIIDEEGNELLADGYSHISHLYDNIFLATKDGGLIGVINEVGEILIPIENNTIDVCLDNNVIISIAANGEVATIYDSKFEIIREVSSKGFQSIEEDSYIKIYNDEDTLYISKEGTEVLNTSLFSSELYPQKQEDGKWVAVDKNLAVITSSSYDKITELNEFGFAAIKQDGKWGAIDSLGNVVVEPIYVINNYKEPSFISKYYEVEYGLGEVYYTNNMVE